MASQEETKSIISSLLTSNPLRSTIRQLCADFQNIVGYKIPTRQLGYTNVEQYLRSIPDVVRVHGNGPCAEVEGIITDKSAHINLMVAKQKKKHVPPNKRHYVQYVQQPRRDFQRRSMPQPSTSQFQTNDNFFKPRQSTPHHSLTDNIKVMHNGYTTSTEHIKVMHNGYAASVEKSIETGHCKEVERLLGADYICKIPRNIQNNLRKLILKFPDGIWCTKLPAEYRNMFRQNIDYEKYNYRSLIEMCTDLSDIFHYIQPSSDDFMLYDKSKPIPSIGQNDNICGEESPKDNEVAGNILAELPKLDWSLGPVLIPPDVLHISDKIPRYFPFSLTEGDYLDVNVGEIYDLSKFWVYLAFGDLERMMAELQTFFKNQRNKYCIPELLLEEGLYCTAIYFGEYHRCVIVNLLPKSPGYVRVLFIDYGTVENVCSNEIWYLPKKFGELPCQAIRTRLSNIYPNCEDQPWTIGSINRFRELVTNTALVAEITRVDREDYILEIYLADISNEKRIFYINDVLVKEGLARYTHEERIKSLVDPYCKPNVKYLHLYPEFYEIESGHAPTTTELNYIIENKIPLHWYMPQYFDIVIDEDVDGTQNTYERANQVDLRESAKNIPSLQKETEFDYSCFPSSMLKEIQDIFEQTEAENKSTSPTPEMKIIINTSTTKVEGRSRSTNDSQIPKSLTRTKVETGSNGETFKKYACNKKRISELIYGQPKDTKSSYNSGDISYTDVFPSVSDISKSTDFSQNLSPLSDSLNNLNLSGSGSPVLNNISTNPFVTKVNSENTNPFVSSNPFICEIDTVNTSSLVERFSKSSEDKLPEMISNKLTVCKNCNCHRNKQSNVNKSTAVDNLVNCTNSSDNVYVKNASTAQAPQAPEGTVRVRTPPGFASLNHAGTSQDNLRLPNYGPYNYYTPPIFQPNPFDGSYQYPINNFPYVQNPLFLPPLANSYFGFIPQSQPNQFNFDVSYLRRALAAPHNYPLNSPQLEAYRSWLPK